MRTRHLFFRLLMVDNDVKHKAARVVTDSIAEFAERRSIDLRLLDASAFNEAVAILLDRNDIDVEFTRLFQHADTRAPWIRSVLASIKALFFLTVAAGGVAMLLKGCHVL